MVHVRKSNCFNKKPKVKRYSSKACRSSLVVVIKNSTCNNNNFSSRKSREKDAKQKPRTPKWSNFGICPGAPLSVPSFFTLNNPPSFLVDCDEYEGVDMFGSHAPVDSSSFFEV